jgi:hypothetical protein
LPTPGSPASRTAAPGTTPPPSTRSSSGTPLLRDRESSTGTCPIGTAGALTGPAVVRPDGCAAASATLPQAWHSAHRPTHLAVSQPHSAQRYAVRIARDLLMNPTLGQRSDSSRDAAADPAC